MLQGHIMASSAVYGLMPYVYFPNCLNVAVHTMRLNVTIHEELAECTR